LINPAKTPNTKNNIAGSRKFSITINRINKLGTLRTILTL
jgi:hypothetical protein